MFVTFHTILSFFCTSVSVKSLIVLPSREFIFVFFSVMRLNTSLCKWRYVSWVFVSFSFPRRILRTNGVRAHVRAGTTSKQWKKICRLLWVPLRGKLWQRSLAHVNPFKTARTHLYVAASRKKGASPTSQTPSSSAFCLYASFPFSSFPFPISLPFSFLCTTFSRFTSGEIIMCNWIHTVVSLLTFRN